MIYIFKKDLSSSVKLLATNWQPAIIFLITLGVSSLRAPWRYDLQDFHLSPFVDRARQTRFAGSPTTDQLVSLYRPARASSLGGRKRLPHQ